MDKKTKTIISFVIAGIILYFVYSKLDFNMFVETIKSINLYFFIAALLLSFAGFYVVAMRWQVLLENAGLKAELSDLTIITIIFYFTNCILPWRLGEFYRSYLIKKNYNYSMSKTMGTIFVERLIDVFFLIILFGLVVLFFFREYVSYLWVSLFTMFITLFIIGFAVKYSTFILSWLPKKIHAIVENFQKGITESVRYRNLHLILWFSLLRWFMTIIPIYFVFLAMDLQLSFLVAMFIVLMSNVVGAIPITPSGLGITELTIVGILIFLGVEKNLAITASFVIRFVNYWMVLFVGGIIYMVSDKK